MLNLKSLTPACGRFFLATIFVGGGLNKIAAPHAALAYISAAGLPLSAYALSIAIEVGCGLLLILGFHTKAVALILAGFCIVTAGSFHTNFADQNQMIHFLENFAIAGGLLQVVTFGPGALSLDSRRGRLSTSAAPISRTTELGSG
jgi:putative oxidoreductase